jgi:hypothetical protein
MGQFSVEKPVMPGSVLSGNQHRSAQRPFGDLNHEQSKQPDSHPNKQPSSPDRRRRALHRSLPKATESYTSD